MYLTSSQTPPKPLSKFNLSKLSYIMPSTIQSNAPSTLDADINFLASAILNVMGDQTIEFQVRGFACFMLHAQKKPLHRCVKLIRKKDAPSVIRKLLRTGTDFMGPTPRTVGVDLVSEMASANIQKSLDVKHVKRKNNGNAFVGLRINPKIKIDLAHSHPEYVWIRFYTTKSVADLDSCIQICPMVYEHYITQASIGGRANGSAPAQQYTRQIHDKINFITKTYNAVFIFCSEFSAMAHEPLIALTNYIRFMWVYWSDRSVFNPRSHEDHFALTQFTFYGLAFLNTNNLTYMPKTTHPPMASCSGERPKVALRKFKPNEKTINEGSRGNQCVDKPSDVGTISNFMEVLARIKLEYNSWIHQIK